MNAKITLSATVYNVKLSIDRSIYINQGGGGLELGETETTAYRGDRGKVAFEHSEIEGNPHNTQIPSKTSDLTNDSNFIVDANYVHTDNNFSIDDKNKLDQQSGVNTGDQDLSGLQEKLNYTPEDIANKSTDGTLASNSNTKYPSEKAVKTYVDGHIPTINDATDIAKGVIKLAGDLGGTADFPTVPNKANITNPTFWDLIDNLKRIILNISNVTSGQTRIVTFPDRNLDLGNATIGTLEFCISGNGGIIQASQYGGYVQIPYSCTITGWSISEGSPTPVNSTATMDVYKKSSYYPQAVDTIFPSTKPNLTAQVNNSATGLNISVSAGDWITFAVTANNNAAILNLVLTVLKS
jgi:hypothetical protein